MATKSKAPAAAPAPEAPAAPAQPTADELREREWAEAGQRQAEEAAAEQPEVVATEQVAEPEPAPSPTVHKHSRRLINDAAEWLNLTRSEIDDTSEDALEDRIAHAKRQYRFAQQQQFEAIQQRTGQPSSPPKQEDVEPEIDLGEDLSGYDEATRKILKKVAAIPLKKVAELEKRLADAEKRDQEREQRTINQRLNAKTREYKAIFSDDATGKAKYAAVMGVLQSRNIQDPSVLEDEFDDAVKVLGFQVPATPKSATPPVPDPIDAALEERKKQFIEGGVAKGTQRNDDEQLSDRERFIRNWDRKQRERIPSDEEYEREYGLNGKK
jgi:hypothetical protein